jgi:hypothetical protein
MDCLRNRRADATWPTAAIAGIIGTASLALLFLTVPRRFFDNVLSPMVKDAYILPERRYRIFDTVLVAWCIDGSLRRLYSSAAPLFDRASGSGHVAKCSCTCRSSHSDSWRCVGNVAPQPWLLSTTVKQPISLVHKMKEISTEQPAGIDVLPHMRS